MPLAILFLAGTVEALIGEGGLPVATGALATGVAMLAYGLRVVQNAFGRPPRAWMTGAMLGSLVPPIYALYVFGWRGLRGFASGGGLSGVMLATLFTLTGVWVLRSWMHVVEVERLARVMNLNTDGEGSRERTGS